MMRKCKYCDAKGEKSINTDTDDYVKLKNCYSHTNCHKIFLKTKKKMSDEIINSEIIFLKNKMAKDQQNIKDKDEFINYIKLYYNISLTNWQYNKIAKVNNGTYKQGMKEGISYCDLLEMWTNKKFLKKLEKIVYNRNLDPTKRFDYDLSIVVDEYDKYKKSKIKKYVELTHMDYINKQKQLTKKSLKKISITDKDEEEIDIFDILD